MSEVEEGLTVRDLILELRKDVKSLSDKFDEDKDVRHAEFQRVDWEISKRPTRAEVVTWFVLAGTLSGLVGALISGVTI